MTQPAPENPHLKDLFRTAIEKSGSANEPPSIVVNGSHNVISWGGTVYMRDRRQEPRVEVQP